MSDPHPTAAPDEHDAWLRQALRHAPDAAAAPPAALREAILAEARSAAQGRRRAAARPSLADRAAAFWSWLARPAVAAGFASVMAATLVGLMWWDRPMDETLPPPPPSSHRAEPEAAPATATGTGAAPSPRTAPLPRPEAPLSRPATAAKRADSPREEKAAAGTTTAAPGKEEVPQDALQAAPSPSPFPGNGPAANAATARDRAAMPGLAKKSEGPTMAAATQAPERAATPPPPAAPTETARRMDIAANDAKGGGGAADAARAATPARQRAATLSSDSAPSREASGTLDATTGAAPRAFAAAPPPLREANSSERRAADAAAARPMAALLGSIAQGIGHWSRTVPAGGTTPLDAPTESWLVSVDAATAGRWQAAGEPASRLEGALTAPANALRLGRDGRNAAIVRVEDTGVLFEMPPGPAWFAPLPPDAVARLQATLAATQR